MIILYRTKFKGNQVYTYILSVFVVVVLCLCLSYFLYFFASFIFLSLKLRCKFYVVSIFHVVKSSVLLLTDDLTAISHHSAKIYQLVPQYLNEA